VNDPIQEFFAEIAELPDFVGISPVGLHARSRCGDTPLHVAAVRGSVHLTAGLLDPGSDINARGEHGYTPLHEAVEQGHFDTVRLLLERGADAEITNSDGQTPLALARLLEHPSIAGLFPDNQVV
jgi:ankyrin repeat protein